MISATQIRKGMIIRLDDKLFRVEDMKHITPGKGNAIVQTKIRDLNFHYSSSIRRLYVRYSSKMSSTLQLNVSSTR